ncbi:putative cation-transporting ATPase 13A1-like, partial [Tropilaelaps mercedesae]
MAVDDLVSTVQTFTWRPLLRDGRIWPFGIVYALWASILGPGSEYSLLALPAIFVLQALVWLGVHWSVGVRRILCCSRATPTSANTCLVRPTENNGSAEFVPLCR